MSKNCARAPPWQGFFRPGLIESTAGRPSADSAVGWNIVHPNRLAILAPDFGRQGASMRCSSTVGDATSTSIRTLRGEEAA